MGTEQNNPPSKTSDPASIAKIVLIVGLGAVIAMSLYGASKK